MPPKTDPSPAGPTGGKPEPPSPEGFGLTAQRAQFLRNPVSVKTPGFWLGNAAVALVVGLGAYGLTGSAVDALVIVFGLSLVVFGVTFLLTEIFALMWRRSQPDYREYARYTRALENYQIRFSGWPRQQESWWQALDGRRFEIELAALLKRLGYDVRHTGRAGDGGVDLVLSRSGRVTLVQRKAHKNPVGPGPVRDLYGTMVHRNAQEAWLVATSGFSRSAQDFARGKGIRLVRVQELLKVDRPAGL
jgi:Restriction endonuclease